MNENQKKGMDKSQIVILVLAIVMLVAGLAVLAVWAFGDNNGSAPSGGNGGPNGSYTIEEFTTVEDYVAAVEDLVIEEEFKEAKKLLEKAESRFAGDEALVELRSTFEKAYVLWLTKEEEAEQALDILESAKGDWVDQPDMVKTKEELVAKFKENALLQAKVHCMTKKYDAAIEVLEKALKWMPDDPDLTQAIEDAKALKG